MSDSYTQLSLGTQNGTYIDEEAVTYGGSPTTRNRSRIVIAGSAAAELAAVLNSAPSTEYGLVVRNIPSGTQTVSVSGTVTVGSHAVTNAGVFAVQVDGDALTALQLIDDTVTTLGTTTYTEASSKGLTIGAVRRDADTTLVGTTNEFGPLQMDANGRLKIEAFSGETLPVSLASVPSHAVTNAGTFAVQVDGSALTALQLIDNIVMVDDAAFTAATSSVVGMGAFFDNSATDSVDENDIGIVRMSANRNMFMNIRDAAGNERGVNVNASNQLTVSVDNSPSVAQATASNLNAQVVGNAASAASDSGNPVKIGGIGRTTNITAVTDGQRVNMTCDDLGRQVVVLNNVRDLVTYGHTTLTNTTETTVLAAAASTFHDVTHIMVSNGGDTAITVSIRDATAGTVRMNIFVAAAGGGATISLPVALPQTSTNNNWTAQASVASNPTYVWIQAVKNV